MKDYLARNYFNKGCSTNYSALSKLRILFFLNLDHGAGFIPIDSKLGSYRLRIEVTDSDVAKTSPVILILFIANDFMLLVKIFGPSRMPC